MKSFRPRTSNRKQGTRRAFREAVQQYVNKTVDHLGYAPSGEDLRSDILRAFPRLRNDRYVSSENLAEMASQRLSRVTGGGSYE